MKCGEMIERDAHVCAKCGSRSPFGYHCPTCHQKIERGNLLCSSCGRALMTTCPYCGGPTFVGAEHCDTCGQSLMIRCESKRCGELQFFENKQCTICGKKIKKAKKLIEANKKGK
jgi:hypothetical protein